jgi:hypothetical protein
MGKCQVAPMPKLVMKIIGKGKRGGEWGGTWVVLGSRKSCDHMCSLFSRGPISHLPG